MRKKLIEVALPLEAINKESAREKSIRHGHPSTLHLWWSRKPLSTCRAVLFASLVDDPSSRPEEFPTPEAQEAERQRLFRILEDLVKWENSNNDEVLERARAEIRRSTGGNPPPILDPFCGGGSIPLEAQRLGLEAHASDLNPVAVLITKALIEIPPKFADSPPVNPKSANGSVSGSACRSAYESAGVSPASQSQKGWYSRGYLPHVDVPGLIQSITFRLADSLPHDVLDRLADEKLDDAERRKRIESFLDAGHGECLLARPEIAQIVENALLHFDGERYRLIAWCVMPNHVHVLIETRAGHPLAAVIHSWKSFTAKEINSMLGRSGEVWQREYFDRYIRDDRHLQAVIKYIEENPVKAKLVMSADDWRFSSAARKEKAGGTPALLEMLKWKRAEGLAEDVRYYGEWMRDEAKRRIGNLYPKVRVTPEMAEGRDDLKPYVGRDLTVIAWLWARTVKCPNPACGAQMPLTSKWWLSKKNGKKAWVEPIVDRETKTVRFETRVGDGEAPEGTVNRRGVRCIVCGEPVPFNHVRSEAQADRIGARLMAIVAEGDRGRVYLSPTPEQEEIAQSAVPSWKPETDLPQRALGFRVQAYGMTKHADLFTDRQLVALTTFSDLIAEVREKVRQDAIAAGIPDDGIPLADGGTGAPAYADAVATYLALAIDKGANLWSSIATWMGDRGAMRETFPRQAIQMSWDFAEANPFTVRGGGFSLFLERIVDIIFLLGVNSYIPSGTVKALDATNSINGVKSPVISTDPPYYDNIGYADLSDFFYVWLRRSLGKVYPDLFATVLTPKSEELVATPYRFEGGKEQAKEFFEQGLAQVFSQMHREQHPDYPLTLFYAFKQDESQGDGEVASTGWETMLTGLLKSGFAITGTWPMRTESSGRAVARGTNALASSIVLVCRPRPQDAPRTTRREFIMSLKQELPQAIRQLQHENIAPVDLAQAVIGPGMAIFSRYREVLEADGSPMTVRTALALINQEIDEILAGQESDFDPETRWAVTWFEQHGFNQGQFGDAETISKAKNTSVSGLVEAGILEASGGKVRLLRMDELDPDWDPSRDKRLTVWEVAHHLIRVLDEGGEGKAARLLRRVGPVAEAARDLAYRLYQICERKGWAQEGIGYNALVVSWPEMKRLAERERVEEPKLGL